MKRNASRQIFLEEGLEKATKQLRSMQTESERARSIKSVDSNFSLSDSDAGVQVNGRNNNFNSLAKGSSKSPQKKWRLTKISQHKDNKSQNLLFLFINLIISKYE